MKRKEFKVVFEPSGRSVYVLPGTVLLEVAARAGYILQTPCGGGGTCGKCRVRVTGGSCPATQSCAKILGDARVREGWRLACQARVQGDAVVEIPAASLFESRQIILSDSAGGELEVLPAVRKQYLDLSAPAQDDALSDVERLRAVIGPFKIGIDLVRELPARLRKAGFKGTAVLADDELVDFEAGDTTAFSHGVAFDIGTTTLVGVLVDLKTGLDLAVDARMNPQTSLGDDVIARIRKCREEPRGLIHLQRAVLAAINEMIGELLRQARVEAGSIYEVVFAGNTAMQQILCGVDPSALGELPFVPAFNDALALKASDLDLDTHPNAKVYVFPQVGGFVGGDTVAGVVATRMDEAESPAMLVDIGTNGEIVLFDGKEMLGTSVAAGPAFEGARISCGMRAAAGAIDKVVINESLSINVIGNARPSGLCGSGLVDAVAELLRVGVIDETGRILEPSEFPDGVPAPIAKRVVRRDEHCHFVLAHASESATGEPLLLFQRDVRELQLATAAIRAGANILLKMRGLEDGDLKTIFIAGGFGNFIRRNNALRIGLLPPVPCRRIRFVGNTCVFGAKRALLSVSEKRYAESVVRRVEHVDLSLSPDFQMEFGSAMTFPNHDGGDCDAAPDDAGPDPRG